MLSIRDLVVLIAVVEWNQKEAKYGAQAQPCTVATLFSAAKGGTVNALIKQYGLDRRKQALPIKQPEQIYRTIRKLVDEGLIYEPREDARQQFVETPEGRECALRLMKMDPDLWATQAPSTDGFLPLAGKKR